MSVQVQPQTKKNAAIGSSNVTTPALLDRFEVKYTIPFSMIDPMVKFILPYCSYDKYSALSPDNFYTINSLYFDTPDYLFLRQRMLKAEKRFNMRIRSYGENPTFPYFLEIKQRIGDIVRKTRARTDDPDFTRYFTADGGIRPPCDDAKTEKHTEMFYRTAFKYNAQPAVLVQYRRLAFFSNIDEYARVTFDRDLHYMPQNIISPIPNNQLMCPCEPPSNSDFSSYVILELKCYTSYVPLWMVDFTRAFNLRKVGFSKYSTCLRPVLSRHTLEGLYRNPSRQSLDFVPEI